MIEFNIGDKIKIIDDGGMFPDGDLYVEKDLKNFEQGYGNNMSCIGMIGTIVTKSKLNPLFNIVYGVRLLNGRDIVITNEAGFRSKYCLELVYEKILNDDLFKME